jgi:uncharacterized protein (DUF58 family)
MASNNLESLRRGNAAKPFQSQLVPHLEFIRSQRAARVPYAQIAAALHDGFGVKISPSSIHAFVKARSRKRDVYTILPALTASLPAPVSPTSTNLRDPVDRLKTTAARSAPANDETWSFYDPARPLEKLSHTK